MKRTMKKAMAFLLTLAMLMSLGVSAFAAAATDVTVEVATNAISISSATFEWGTSDATEISDFKTALTASGTTVSVAFSESQAKANVTGLPTGYSVAEVTIGGSDESVALPIKKSSTDIGTLTVDINTISGDGTVGIKLTPSSASAGGSGTDATSEAAADNSSSAISGAGSYEGFVSKEVFRVTLPTATAADLAFTIDPLGLIEATDAAAKSGKKFVPGQSVFFPNTNNKVTLGEGADAVTYDYSSSSDKFTVINKGSVDVDVELTVTATGTAITSDDSTITFVSDTDDFTDSEDTSLYIALNTKGTDDDDATVTPIEEGDTATAATVSATVEATDGAYEYTYDATNGYEYSLKSSVTTFKQLELWLSGAANTNATEVDWGLAGDDALTLNLDLTWKVTQASGDDSGGGSSGPAATATPGTVANGTVMSVSLTNMTGYTFERAYWLSGTTETALTATCTAIAADGTATASVTATRAFANDATATKIYIVVNDGTDDTALEVTVKG